MSVQRRMSAFLPPEQSPRPRFAHLALEPPGLRRQHRSAETGQPVVAAPDIFPIGMDFVFGVSALVMLGGTIWMANDGGVYVSHDGGQVWQPTVGLETVDPVNLAGLFGLGNAPALYFGCGDNDDFFTNRTREQEPVYSVQGGGIRIFSSGAWLALFATYFSGGRTTVDGVRGSDFKDNSRIGLTFTLPINRNNSVKLYANTGVSTRTGADFDALGIAWQYRWGGGL